MPTLTIRGVPSRLLLRLQERAAAHRRSLRREILAALKQSVTAEHEAQRLLALADALRGELRVSPLTDSLLRVAKTHGRRRPSFAKAYQQFLSTNDFTELAPPNRPRNRPRREP